MNEKKILGRDGISAAKKLKTRTIDCRPELDGEFLMRQLTYGEAVECGADMAKQLTKMLVDESGQPFLTDDDATGLLDLNAGVAIKLITAANELHLLTKQAAEDAKKNSTTTSSDDSVSAPPSP